MTCHSVHDLTTQLIGINLTDNPFHSARDMLQSMAEDRDTIESLLDYVVGTGGNALQAFYRTPDLSLLKVRFAAGRRTPLHNHGTWAVILLLSGSERNTLYRRKGDGALELAGDVLLEPGSVLPMGSETVHVAACVGTEPAVGLHVYGADVLGVDRQMWDPDSLAEEPLNFERYESLAQRASAAPRAPLT